MEQQGKVYCCDMCAQGPKMMARMPMMRFMLAGIGLVGLLGFLLDLLVDLVNGRRAAACAPQVCEGAGVSWLRRVAYEQSSPFDFTY